jgi:hypothetical protein
MFDRDHPPAAEPRFQVDDRLHAAITLVVLAILLVSLFGLR